jgi:predicted dehydrogenase
LGSVGASSLAAVAVGAHRVVAAPPALDPKVFGEAGSATAARSSKVWQPVSDRKIRVGIAGDGFCQFGAAFGFQDHPNVTVAAVTDLISGRCAGLAAACRCAKSYPSLEEMVKDDTIEAIFVATDAPSHARHCIEVMKHGKDVASAVPAAFGSLEEAQTLYDAVRTTGRKYMMFETSAFRPDCHAMRQAFKSGALGKLVYSEGEYFHYSVATLPSYHEWRGGLPPQWYPTHSNAYYISVSGGSFTEVSCQGMPSLLPVFQPKGNKYANPFGTEIALLRTSEGGMARMAVSWDTPGPESEVGRVRGQLGSMAGTTYNGESKALPNFEPPPLPPHVDPGGHGGSHGPLMNEFVTAILQNRKPLIDILMALNLTVPGIVSHQSALKDGETLKIPQFKEI